MKTPVFSTLLLAAAFAATAALAAPIPRLEVTVVTDPGGTVAYQGQANASGAFSASKLTPGNYIVQFNSKTPAAMKGRQFGLGVQSGRAIATAKNVPGEKFDGGGVAMKIEVGKTGKLNGQVSPVASVSASDPHTEKVRANVKVMNGKRYVWVPGGIETRMGGRWVEEGTEGARISTSNRKGEDGEVLRHIQEQASNSGVQPDGFGLPAANRGP